MSIEKAKLRQRLIAERSDFQQTDEVVSGLSGQIEALCLKLKVNTVAGYLPFGNEPDIEAVLLSFITKGLNVVMPISNSDGSLTWVRWHGEHRRPGIYKFEEAHGEPADPNAIDLILVPALAVTAQGMRIGKGKGFYDRALANYQGRAAAVVFDHEVLDSLPSELHDQKVQFVVTQNRTISTS